MFSADRGSPRPCRPLPPQHRRRNPAATWLSLGPAARLVGVDPDTLRRWADAGQVDVFTTPGGHRRFDRRRARADARRPSAASPAAVQPGRDPGAAVARIPAELRGPGPGSRASAEGPPRTARRTARTAGAWSTALVAHLDADPADARRRASSEATAAELVDDLGRRLAASGVSLTDAVAQFVVARRPFLTELAGIGRRRIARSRPSRRALRGRLGRSRPAAAPLHRRPRGWTRHDRRRRLLTDRDRRSSPWCSRLALFDQWRERRGAFQLVWAHRHALLRHRGRLRGDRRIGGWNEAAVPDVVPDGRRLDRRLARPRDGVPARARPASATPSRCACSWPGCSRSSSATAPSTRAPGRCRSSTSSRPASSPSRSPSRRTSRTSAGRCSRRAPSSARRCCRSC